MTETTSRYPQPREGINGQERTEDDLLDLDDAAIARRLMMIQMAQALYSSVLVGDPAPKVAEMYARMTRPQPGDLVMEHSTPYQRANDTDSAIKGFGILQAHRTEWAQPDAEWQRIVADGEASEDDERFTDDAWYVQYGPAAEDVCRWTNASFVAIPTSRDFTAARPDPGSSQ